MAGKIDYDLVAQLHDNGFNDTEIAEKVGCSNSSVSIWRRKNNKAIAKRVQFKPGYLFPGTRLSYIKEAGHNDSSRPLRLIRCKCFCGTVENFLYCTLKKGSPKTCGCLSFKTNKPKVLCAFCGGPFGGGSVGVCQKNLECIKEYNRLRHLASGHTDLTYVMYSPALISHKIGHTTNISKRLPMLRCGCWDLELVTTFPHGRKLEKWLHKRFSLGRIEGTEWFTGLTETAIKEAVVEYESIQ